jgi:hypothetical protein
MLEVVGAEVQAPQLTEQQVDQVVAGQEARD